MSPGQKRSRTLLWDNYRMRPEDYDRMYQGQGGRCAICHCEAEELHVDHCHATGFVRGLLCRNCNMGLGSFRDSEASLRRAIAYLSDWRKDYRDACRNCWDISGDLDSSIRDPSRLERTINRKQAQPSVMAHYTCDCCGASWRTGWIQHFTPCLIGAAA